MKRKKILLSGSTGFIFSNFVRKVYKDKLNYDFVSVDKIIASYNRYNVKEYEKLNHKLYIGDIADNIFMNNVFAIEKPDYVIHAAAESFVDASLTNALVFAHSNVLGTQVVIDMCVKYEIEKLLYINSDEIYGTHKSKNDIPWTEKSVPNPSNTYSASKMAGELLVKAANNTHGLNFLVSRSSNCYGPRQPPRNLIPKIIHCILNDKEIKIHSQGESIREWLFVDDKCDGIMKILENGKINEVYNIGSGIEKTNLEMIEVIEQILDKKAKISLGHIRKGLDYRYSLNCDKIKNIEWNTKYTFEQGIEKCIQWYLDNPWFFNSILE